MPYNTNWKDGKPMAARPRNKETPDPLSKRGNYMVSNNYFCKVCNQPHSPDYCVVAQKMQEEGMLIEDNGEDHKIYLTSDTFYHAKEGYSYFQDEGYEYDVSNQKYNVHIAEQQIFYDSDEDYIEPHPVEAPVQYNVRRPTIDEIKIIIVAALEQARSKYWLRKKKVNESDGVPGGIFVKDQNTTQESATKPESKQHDKIEKKPVQEQKVMELNEEIQMPGELNRKEKG